MPNASQAEIETLLAATIADAGWTAAPELAAGDSYTALGWKRDDGDQVVG